MCKYPISPFCKQKQNILVMQSLTNFYRARDELQRRENDPGEEYPSLCLNNHTNFFTIFKGLGQSSSRSVESFDPFDPRSRDQESEGQFVNRIDNVMLS